MARKKADPPIELDGAFRERLGQVLEGDGVSYCYQCGACVGDCPTARFSEDFNPRTIMMQVLYGMEEELIGGGSVIWQCSNCFTCFDRCPQDVKPIEVIIALKNLMTERGLAPAGVVESAERSQDIDELEQVTLTDLADTKIGKASRQAVVTVAIAAMPTPVGMPARTSSRAQ